MDEFKPYIESMSRGCKKIYGMAIKLSGGKVKEFLTVITGQDLWLAYLGAVESAADLGGMTDLLSADKANLYAEGKDFRINLRSVEALEAYADLFKKLPQPVAGLMAAIGHLLYSSSEKPEHFVACLASKGFLFSGDSPASHAWVNRAQIKSDGTIHLSLKS